MIKQIHLLASIIASLTIATFFISSVYVELQETNEAIAFIKDILNKSLIPLHSI